MKEKSTEFRKSSRRSWASWAAVGIPVFVLILLVAFSIRILERQAAVAWVLLTGNSFSTQVHPTHHRPGDGGDRIIEAAAAAGVEHCHVEQDQSSDPIASIGTSMKYLKSL